MSAIPLVPPAGEPLSLAEAKTFLRLETAEGLAHGNMAGVEFVGDMVLPKPSTRLYRARDDPIRQYLADADGDGVVCALCHFL